MLKTDGRRFTPFGMERLRRLHWNERTVPPERARRLTGIRTFSCTIFSDMVCRLLSEWCVATSFYQSSANRVSFYTFFNLRTPLSQSVEANWAAVGIDTYDKSKNSAEIHRFSGRTLELEIEKDGIDSYEIIVVERFATFHHY